MLENSEKVRLYKAMPTMQWFSFTVHLHSLQLYTITMQYKRAKKQVQKLDSGHVWRQDIASFSAKNKQEMYLLWFYKQYWTTSQFVHMLALLSHILHSIFLFDLYKTLLKFLTFSHRCTSADNRPKWWSGFLWVLVNISRVRLFQVKWQLDDSVDFGRDLMLRTIQNNG